MSDIADYLAEVELALVSSPLENAPHHIHLNHERDVVPGYPVSMIELLNILEEEIPPTINI